VATETLSIHILGKDYQVACPVEEQEALIKAGAELDRRMKMIRQSGSVIGLERIAVMAALNLAHEVISPVKTSSPLDAQLVEDMCHRVDAIFSG
jgi:cell division protein ZapA